MATRVSLILALRSILPWNTGVNSGDHAYYPTSRTTTTFKFGKQAHHVYLNNLSLVRLEATFSTSVVPFLFGKSKKKLSQYNEVYYY